MRRTALFPLGFACALALPLVGSTAQAQPVGATVQVIDFEFTPRSVTVGAGATVLWRWEGAERHTVSARDGSFDSGERARGDQFSFVFRTPGTFEYSCRIHPSMVGTVSVQAAPASPRPSPRPTSAAPSPSAAPASARPSPSRTSSQPQPLPAPTSAQPTSARPTSTQPSSKPSAVITAPSKSALAAAPKASAASQGADPASTPPSTVSRSSLPAASLDEPQPKDRTGLAVAIGVLVAAAGIGGGTALLLRGRLARKLSSPSP